MIRGGLLFAVAVAIAIAAAVVLLAVGDISRVRDATVGRTIPIPSRVGVRYVNGYGLAAVIATLAAIVVGSIGYSGLHPSRRKWAVIKRALRRAAKDPAEARHRWAVRSLWVLRLRSKIVRSVSGR